MSWDWERLKQQQRGQGAITPQVDEMVKQFKKFRLPGGPLALGVIVLALIRLTAIYTINQDEVGIVQRFGRYIETTQPGLNFKLPLGIDTVTKVNAKRVQTEEFGASVAEVEFRPRTKTGTDSASVALMLTGDLNVAVVPWIVQYRIKDPYNFLFKVGSGVPDGGQHTGHRYSRNPAPTPEANRLMRRSHLFSFQKALSGLLLLRQMNRYNLSRAPAGRILGRSAPQPSVRRK